MAGILPVRSFTPGEWSCDYTSSNLLQVVQEVAHIYGDLMTRDCSARQCRDVDFIGNHNNIYPSKDLIDIFEQTLKSMLIEKFNLGRPSITLSNDYSPYHLLADVLKQSGLSEGYYPYPCYFPMKSATRISIQDGKINISMTSGASKKL